MKSNHGISRRSFLRGLGAGVALAPFVPLLNATGQEMRYPKRLILFYSPDGTGYNDWAPSGSGTSYTPGAIHEPLMAHKPNINILGGLSLTAAGAGEGHAYGMCGLWTASRCKEGTLFDGGNEHMTGWGSGTSVDQTVARAYGPGKPYMLAPGASPPEVPYRTLELGIQTGDDNIVTRMIYAGDDAPIAPDPNPYSVFERLFGGGIDDAAAQRRRMARRSVLDLVHGELATLQGHRAAATERPKIDAHLEGIRAIEQRLDLASATCVMPTVSGMMDINSNDNFPDLCDLQMDMLVHALACDMTRVVSLQLSRGFSGVRHTWIGATDGHHSLSHVPSPDWNARIDTWYAGKFARFLDALNAVPEGDGTLLTNSLVVWGRELAVASGHALHPAPFVVAGNAGGAVTTGSFIDYGDVGHNRLLVSICNAMGLTEITSYGNLDTEAASLGW